MYLTLSSSFELQTFGWTYQEAKLHMVPDYFSNAEVSNCQLNPIEISSWESSNWIPKVKFFKKKGSRRWIVNVWEKTVIKSLSALGICSSFSFHWQTFILAYVYFCTTLNYNHSYTTFFLSLNCSGSWLRRCLVQTLDIYLSFMLWNKAIFIKERKSDMIYFVLVTAMTKIFIGFGPCRWWGELYLSDIVIWRVKLPIYCTCCTVSNIVFIFVLRILIPES